MDNLPIKRQPLPGERVKRRDREAIGTVIESDHWGVGVRYSDTRVTYYYYRTHNLEVVA